MIFTALLALAGSTPGTAASKPTEPTVVTFTFDDGFVSQLPAAEALAERGLAGTFYVNSGSLGLDAYMTAGHLRRLEGAGHEIAGHGLAHVRLTDVPASKLQRLVCDDREALAKLGLAVGNFAYPYGADNPAVERVVQDCGYKSARDVGGLFSGPNDCPDCPAAEDLPPTDRIWRIRTHTTVRQGAPGLEAVKRHVTRAEETGGWVPLVFHRICDGCSEESMSIGHFTELVEWLEARPTTTRVQTVADIIGPVAEQGAEQVGDESHDTEAFTVDVGGVVVIPVILLTASLGLILIWYRLRRHGQ